jgi:hypothetical protein
MNEKELKQLFISSVRSGHIKTNTAPNYSSSKTNYYNGSDEIGRHFFPTSANPEVDIKIKDEGYFRSFDLVIAVIDKRNNCNSNIIYDSIEAYDNYFNVLMRSGILAQFAKSERCRIDWIRFYPVEVKSDSDVLDERLPNQILNAILTFGRSVIVLDEKHSQRIKGRGTLNLIPCTIIGYAGKDDYFNLLSVFDKLVTNAMFNIQKRRLARILQENGVTAKIDKIYQCISNIQKLNQKLAFGELYDDSVIFLQEEIEFLQGLINLNVHSEKKQLAYLVNNTKDNKITDYI